jgi:serine/threonine protein kinase
MNEASSPNIPALRMRPGDTLAKRYKLTRKLGAGGYSTVFAATDAQEQRDVAIKILKTDGAHNDPSALGRLRQEALLLRSIRHPNVLRIFDFERHGDIAFLVMEMLDGHSLARIIATEGPAPSERVLPVVKQLLSALNAAHQNKILHRDIKPENILLCAPGPKSKQGLREVAKLVDFGLAKSYAPWDDETDKEELQITLVKTKAGGFLGTPRYTPPEQAVGDPVGPYTDLFSLGLVIAEWLTGELRLKGDTHAELMRNLVGPDPVYVGDCPQAWRGWLRRMLDKNPENRIQNASQAMNQLQEMVVAELNGNRRAGELAFDSEQESFVDAFIMHEDGPTSFLDEDGPLELDLDKLAETQRPKTVSSPEMWALANTALPDEMTPPMTNMPPLPGQEGQAFGGAPPQFQGTDASAMAPPPQHGRPPNMPPMRATPLQGATGEFNSPFGPGQYPLSHTSEIERPRIYQVPDDDDDFDIARSPVALIAIGAISCFGILALWLLYQLIF